jgi:hypothetical protein
MPKAEPKHCLSCRRAITDPPFGIPAICKECWATMTPAERAARQEAWNHERKLFELILAVENNAYLAKQTARLAKVLEALLRELKQPFDGMQNLIDRLNDHIDRTEREYDEGEEWKRGKSEDDDLEIS